MSPGFGFEASGLAIKGLWGRWGIPEGVVNDTSSKYPKVSRRFSAEVVGMA